MKVFSIALACFFSVITLVCVFGAIWTTGDYYPGRLGGTAFFMFWLSFGTWVFAILENGGEL